MFIGSITTSEPVLAAGLMEMIPAAVYTCAADGRIVQCNGRATALWGRTPGSADRAERFCGAFRLFHIDGRPLPPGDAPMAHALRTGNPVTDTPVIMERPDGSRVPVLVSVAPVRNDKGGLVGAIACMQDVSSMRPADGSHADAELREALAEAERANRAKMEFLAIMSHELRTPLNAIGGYTELIALGIHGAVTDEQRAALQRIRRSQEHLLSLINDVLSYARVEAGGLRYRVTDVRMAEALSAADALVVRQMRGRGIAYHYSPCDETIVARADPDRLQQILLNLLSNAAKFTPPGRQVALGCTAHEGRVFIHVRDQGPGIPADKLETIFEPFVQLSPVLTRTGEGVGLGLAISRDIARAMGGDLLIESVPDLGSTFEVILPSA